MQQDEFPQSLSLLFPLRLNWKLLLAGSIFCFLFASILFSGWPSGLIPNLKYPYIYGGDINFTSWEIKRVIEGWLFENPHSGYPFGSNFLDYPHSDNGNLIILKALGTLTGTYYGALNLYILLGFPLAFIFSFLALKSFALRTAYAFVGGMLFAFAPFHFLRLGHVFYTWYFVVPIYFFYGWKIFLGDFSIWPLNTPKKILTVMLPLIILSSFGVYYASFGILLFIVAGVAASFRNQKSQGLFSAVALSSLVALGVTLNVLPTLVYKHTHSKNFEAAFRLPEETERYSLKIVHLFFPSSLHRIRRLGNYINLYGTHFGMNEAAATSALGFFASIGFLILLFSLFYASLGKQIDIRLRLLAILVLTFLLVATVGSFNVLFALFVSPLIRAWNRISIFISFAAFIGFFVMLQHNKKVESLFAKNAWMGSLIPLSILFIGLFDQTPKTLQPLTQSSQQQFVMERNFIKKIEATLPPGSSIYQLPYVRFPEYGQYLNLPDYELLGGYLNSKTLRWSTGSIRGREGDLFYRSLAQEPIEKQLEIIRSLGFSGIYIDRRGFEDNANSLIEKLTKLLGAKPFLVREDNQVFFYQIMPVIRWEPKSLTAAEIINYANHAKHK
ncbi:sugar translocase [Tatlockia micdadei]|uniref:sugar translocase n=1 Tax=Legionella micdadei TaxID=451 RepID=UPI00156E1CD4|nr:sugar translocase [Legionella micdadei]NSL17169.1 sugar translocase [Legionella micdadei]